MIRTLIVDDEAPGRAKLRKLLAAERDVEIVGEASDGEEAVEEIRRLRPDAVFLDIRMPRLDGFEVVESIGVESMPPVVFVTAYDEHAVRAFEVHALDYLLKPFGAARLRRAVERLRDQIAGRGDLAARLRAILPRYVERLIAKKDEDREVLLSVEKIDVIRADRNRLRLITSEGELSRRGPISALAERLDPDRFLRINRSEIVRLDAIRELQPWFHGDCRVVLHDGTTLMWSRRYRAGWGEMGSDAI